MAAFHFAPVAAFACPLTSWNWRREGILKYQRPRPPFVYPPQLQESLLEISQRFKGYPFLSAAHARESLDDKVQEYCTEYEWLLMRTIRLWYCCDPVDFDVWYTFSVDAHITDEQLVGQIVIRLNGTRATKHKMQKHLHEWRRYDVLSIGQESIVPFMGSPLDLQYDTQSSP